MDRYPDAVTISEFSPQESLREPSSPLSEEGFSESEMGEGQVYMPNLSIRQIMENVPKDRSISAGMTPFRFNASSVKKSNFTLKIRNKEFNPTDKYEPEPEDKLNLSGFYSDGLSSIQFNRIKSRKDIPGTRTGRPQQIILDSTKNYDISPWVKQVVDKIRNNWSVPFIKESLAMGEVKIYVSVNKNGKLLNLEILNSSDLINFDETALKAIQSSLPFPPLPDEFPYEMLEAFLVFQFNE